MIAELTAQRAVDATATPYALAPVRSPQPAAADGAPVRSMSPSEGDNWFFLDAAQRLGVNPDVVQLLTRPYRELHVEIPVHMDDGMGDSRCSPAIACSTAERAGPTRAGCAFTRRRIWTR